MSANRRAQKDNLCPADTNFSCRHLPNSNGYRAGGKKFYCFKNDSFDCDGGAENIKLYGENKNLVIRPVDQSSTEEDLKKVQQAKRHAKLLKDQRVAQDIRLSIAAKKVQDKKAAVLKAQEARLNALRIRRLEAEKEERQREEERERQEEREKQEDRRRKQREGQRDKVKAPPPVTVDKLPPNLQAWYNASKPSIYYWNTYADLKAFNYDDLFILYLWVNDAKNGVKSAESLKDYIVEILIEKIGATHSTRDLDDINAFGESNNLKTITKAISDARKITVQSNAKITKELANLKDRYARVVSDVAEFERTVNGNDEHIKTLKAELAENKVKLNAAETKEAQIKTLKETIKTFTEKHAEDVKRHLSNLEAEVKKSKLAADQYEEKLQRLNRDNLLKSTENTTLLKLNQRFEALKATPTEDFSDMLARYTNLQNMNDKFTNLSVDMEQKQLYITNMVAENAALSSQLQAAGIDLDVNKRNLEEKNRLLRQAVDKLVLVENEVKLLEAAAIAVKVQKQTLMGTNLTLTTEIARLKEECEGKLKAMKELHAKEASELSTKLRLIELSNNANADLPDKLEQLRLEIIHKTTELRTKEEQAQGKIKIMEGSYNDRIQKLHSENRTIADELAAKLQQHKKQNQAGQLSNQLYVQRIAELEKTLTEKEKLLLNKEDLIASTNVKLDECEARINLLSQESKTVAEGLTARLNAAELLVNESTATKADLTTALQQVKELTASIAAFEQQISDLKAENAVLREQITSLSKTVETDGFKYTEITQANEALKVELAQVKQQVEAEKRKNTGLMATMKQFETDKEALALEVANNKRELQDAKGNITNLKALNKDLEAQVEQVAKATNADLGQIVEKLNTEHRAALELLRTESLTAAQGFDSQIKVIQAKNNRLTQQNQKNTGRITALLLEKQGHEAMIVGLEKLKPQIDEYLQDIEAKREENTRLTEEIKTLQQEILIHGGKINQQKGRFETVSRENAVLKEELNSLMQNLNQLKQDKANLLSDIGNIEKGLSGDCAKLSQSNNAAAGRIKELQAQKVQLLAKDMKTNTDLNKAKSAFYRMQTETQLLTLGKAELQQKVKKLAHITGKAQPGISAQEHAAIVADYARLKQDNKRLTAELQAKKVHPVLPGRPVLPVLPPSQSGAMAALKTENDQLRTMLSQIKVNEQRAAAEAVLQLERANMEHEAEIQRITAANDDLTDELFAKEQGLVSKVNRLLRETQQTTEPEIAECNTEMEFLTKENRNLKIHLIRQAELHHELKRIKSGSKGSKGSKGNMWALKSTRTGRNGKPVKKTTIIREDNRCPCVTGNGARCKNMIKFGRKRCGTHSKRGCRFVI